MNKWLSRLSQPDSQPSNTIVEELFDAYREARKDSPKIAVECWTPTGIRRLVYADSPEHAEWIRAANPPPVPNVRCADCTHATVTSGIARCGAGVDSGLPTGGWWAADRHLCRKFEERP